MTFPSLFELYNSGFSEDDVPGAITDVVERVRGASFQRWYHADGFAANVRNGQSYFNGPSPPPDPLRHSPSQLLQCCRKVYYRQHNAPKETADPFGIFWIGEHVETDLILPYFQDVVDDHVYLQNSVWVDFTVKSRIGNLHLKGETDPVFVDSDGTPFLVSEIKTKDSIEHLDSPNDHHLAQVHAYMYGLTQKFDRRVTEALLVYVDRSTLNLKAFHVEFDPLFWRRRVLDWAATQSEYRIKDRLPPADPEFRWECEFCSYRERCGKETDNIGTNSPPIGFVPLREYPETAVARHLEAYRDQDVKLTPTLGHQYSYLADQFGVYGWICQECDSVLVWDSIDPSGSTEAVPCPQCGFKEEGQETVRGPTPTEQISKR